MMRCFDQLIQSNQFIQSSGSQPFLVQTRYNFFEVTCPGYISFHVFLMRNTLFSCIPLISRWNGLKVPLPAVKNTGLIVSQKFKLKLILFFTLSWTQFSSSSALVFRKEGQAPIPTFLPRYQWQRFWLKSVRRCCCCCCFFDRQRSLKLTQW